MKNEYFVLAAILAFIYVIKVIKNGKFSITESIFWFFGSMLMLILSIFPKFFDFLALKLKIDYPPSLFFLICILFLLYINFRNSKKIAELDERNYELAQRISLLNLKNKIKEKK